MATANVTPPEKRNQSALIDQEGFLEAIVQHALQEFMEAEITEHLQALPYERSDDRTGQRNGYKNRILHLTVGNVSLRVPQARDGSFHTGLFECYQRSERAFTLAIIQMYISGVSTRKVDAITDMLCSVSFSKSTVSELCKKLDGHVEAWKSRDLSSCGHPYLFVDALYENVRVAGRVVSEGVLIVSGVRDDGKRDVLDVVIADTESEAAYNDLFRSLRERGLAGVLSVTSDAHSGLKAAVKRFFHGASWQRCQVHFLREAMRKVSVKRRGELAEDLSAVFGEGSKDKAVTRAKEVADKWRGHAPRAAAMIDEGAEDCLSVLAFPEEHQVKVRTNNFMERLNKEIRRRDKSIEVFPDEASAMRVICAICIELAEEWLSGKAALDMSLLYVEDEPVEAVARFCAAQELKVAS